eukprot:13926102-Heterocapsa_arctica.AAC.1
MRLPSFGGSYIAVPLLGAVTLCVVLCLTLSRDVEKIQLCRSRDKSQHLFHDEADVEAGSADHEPQSFVEDPDVAAESARVGGTDPASQAVLYRGL